MDLARTQSVLAAACIALSLPVLSKAQEMDVAPLRQRACSSKQGSVLPVVSTGDRILQEGSISYWWKRREDVGEAPVAWTSAGSS